MKIKRYGQATLALSRATTTVTRARMAPIARTAEGRHVFPSITLVTHYQRRRIK